MTETFVTRPMTFYTISRTRTKTHKYKTKASVYVLEEPRDQDHGLEDYKTTYQSVGEKVLRCCGIRETVK